MHKQLLLVEKIIRHNNITNTPIKKEGPLPISLFDAHYQHHDKQQVDTTSFQAKRLGLTYLGFGRYGMVNPSWDHEGDQPNFIITHTVKNGLLQEVPMVTDPTQVQNDPAHEHIKKFTDRHPLYPFKNVGRNSIEKEISGKPNEHKQFVDTIASLVSFTTSDFNNINKVLFAGFESKAHPKIINKVTNLDRLFKYDFAKLKNDTSVYKGTLANLEKGKDFVFPGFMSTTLSPAFAAQFTSDQEPQGQLKPTLLQIDLKKGQRAVYVDPLLSRADGSGPDKPEHEYLLPRNSRLKVTDGPIYLKNAIVWKAELDQDDDDFDSEA